jgi:hypothetical protein
LGDWVDAAVVGPAPKRSWSSTVTIDDVPPRILRLFDNDRALPKTTRVYTPESGWESLPDRPLLTWGLIDQLFDLGVTSVELVWRHRTREASILGLRSTRVLPRAVDGADGGRASESAGSVGPIESKRASRRTEAPSTSPEDVLGALFRD